MAIKRGERVTLITKIAAALSGRGWSDIDLILEQFDFPISNSWQGDEYSYVMEHIKRGPDEALLELHDYLFPADAVAPQSEHAREEDAGGIWQPGFFRLFLSHSSKHSVEMGQLKEALRVFGIDAFVAHNDIEPTQEWRDVIEVGLRTCEAFAAYITPEFRLSEWCDQEVGVALARGILVIPIRRGQTPYGFLGKYQALPGGSKGMPRLAEDIAEVIGQHPFTSKRYTAANETVSANQAVDALEAAPSYNAARAALRALENVPDRALTPELLERIQRACATNGELAAQWAFGATTVADQALRRVESVQASDDTR